MSIRILGPFDRYNYGDLLFPLILRSKLASLEVGVSFYGLVCSDLSEYGAVKTKSITDLYSDLSEGDKVIVAGGESLCTSWADLYSYISDPFDLIYGNRLAKAVDRRLGVFSLLGRYLCGGKGEYPFLVSSEDIGHPVKLCFNAVGGAALASWPERRAYRFVQRLKGAQKIGVRDNSTRTSLVRVIPDLDVELVPDSAILMDQMFSDILDLIRVRDKYNLPSQYIFFQVGNEKFTDLGVIYRQLKLLADMTGYVIVLCAIGHALGHEDLKPLKRLYDRSLAEGRKDFIFIQDRLNVYDLMCLIKESSLYIGTSLHGVITSMSFGVPYVALNKDIVKVGEYLRTWGVAELDAQCSESEIFESARSALSVTKESMLSIVASQKKLANEFLDRLLE